jgi:MoaA/NifB/PqqE/SkfB family radical SAM enzyme
MTDVDTTTDRRDLPHIRAGRKRLENLWAKGTDYCVQTVADARSKNHMLHLDLDLTGNCKLKCFYCDRTPDRYSDVPNRVELTTTERKHIIKQAKDLGATTIEFPGAGEPMIDDGFWDVLQYIQECGMTSVIFTSGYHLNPVAIDRLYKLDTTIFLKHNSDSERVQDKMVGVKGYGEIATTALHQLVQRGFNKSVPTRMAVDMVITPQFQDLAEVGTIFRWCRDNNVHMYIMTLIPEGMADHQKMLFERDRAQGLVEFMADIDRHDYGLEYVPQRPMGGGYRCRQVNVGLFVNLFGEVYDCNGLGRLLGHLRRDSLADVWNSKFANTVRTPDQDGFCLVRERLWQSRDASAMERKVKQYKGWERRNGRDAVVEHALDEIGDIEILRRGSRPPQSTALPLTPTMESTPSRI